MNNHIVTIQCVDGHVRWQINYLRPLNMVAQLAMICVLVDDLYAAGHVPILHNAQRWPSCTLQDYMASLGFCIVYFKQYHTYHDTHEAIFDMYQ